MSQEDRVTDVIASDINRRFDRLSEYLILNQRLFGSLRALLNLQEVPMQEFLRDQDSRYLVKMSRGRSQSFVAMDEQTARTYLGALDKDALRSEAGNFTFLRLDSSGFEQIFAGLTEFLTSFQERAATNAAPPEEASCPVQEGVARTPVSSSPVSSFVGRLVQYHVGMGDIPLTHDQALEILATNPNARFTAVVQTSDGFAVERALLTEQLADPSAGGVSEATFFAKTPDGRPIFPVDKNGEGELEQVRGRRGRRGGGGRGRGNGPFNRALERGRDPLEPFDVEDSLAGGFRTRTGIRAGKFDGEAMGTTLNNPDACRLFSRTELERVESTAADLPEGEAEVTQRITHEASAEERVADPLTRGLRALTPQMTLGRFVSGSVTNTAIMAAGYGSTRLYEYIVGRRATTLEQHATGLAPIFLSIGATCLIHRTSPIPQLLHLPGGIAAIAPMGMAVSYAQQVMGINPESAEGLITHWVGTGILATLSSNAVLTYGGVGFSSAGLGMSFSGMLVGVASGIGVGAALAAGVAIGHHVVDPIWGRIINSLVGCVNEDFVESNDGTLSGVLAEALYRIV